MSQEDIEIMRACAVAMGYEDVRIEYGCMGTAYVRCGVRPRTFEFRPLHDDAQAMALVKRFHPSIELLDDGTDSWMLYLPETGPIYNANLNRAICKCVVMLQKRAL